MKCNIRNPICTPTPRTLFVWLLSTCSSAHGCTPEVPRRHRVLQVTVQCDIIYTVRSALQRRVLQVIMKWDIKNPICTPTSGIASYYEMQHQKSDLHSNTMYRKLL